MIAPGPFKTGDAIDIFVPGALASLRGYVKLASANGKSLVLVFEGILDGHLGMMPVLLGDDGVYRSIVTGCKARLRKLAGSA